jgi:probable phosphoglycerate mutase
MPFYFVRHGQTRYDGPLSLIQGRAPGGLTEKGWQAVRQTADVIREISPRPVRIISSPAERARQTASILVKRLDNLPVSIDKRLAPMNKGVFEGLPVERIRNEISYYTRRDTEPIPGGESYRTFRERVSPALLEYSRAEDPVILVGHSDALALFPWLAGFTADPDYSFRVLDNGGMLWAEEAENETLSYYPLLGALDDNLEAT